MSSTLTGKGVIDRLTKILEDFQQYNENWFTEEEEAKAVLEEIQKENIFVNPCTHLRDIWLHNCVAFNTWFCGFFKIGVWLFPRALSPLTSRRIFIQDFL